MNRKIKWKFNLLDAVIIILALAAGFAGYHLINADRGGGGLLVSGSSVTVRYTLELYDLPTGTAALILPGHGVMEVVEKRNIGTVVSVSVEPYRMTSTDRYTGETRLQNVPDRERAHVVMEISVTETERELSASGFIVRGGEGLSVTGPGWAGQGFILDIERG